MTKPAVKSPGNDPQALAAQLAVLGERYDAGTLFPTESLAVLAQTGLHRRFAPPEAGGNVFASEQARYETMFDALHDVGNGDLSVGRLFEGHINALLLFGWYGSSAQKHWLGEQLARSAWFGVWATEPAPGVAIHDGANHAVLTGSKCFASGAGGIDYAIITAQRASDKRRIVVVPANDPSRTDLSAWRVRGMRASVSGSYDLNNLTVPDDAMIGAPGDYDGEPHFTAGAWRFCAVQLGGIAALVGETARQMHADARGDPVRRGRFASAYVAMRHAEFWVRDAARKAAHSAPDAIVVTRIARGVVEDAGLLAMETAARLIGTRSAFDGQRADKIARDLSLYLRQAGPDHARDEAAKAILASMCCEQGDQR